jgi:hypothetical protein
VQNFLFHVTLCDLNVMTLFQGMWSGFASDQRSNVKKFLSAVAEMGLPGFSVKDLEEVRLLPFVAVNILIVGASLTVYISKKTYWSYY